MSLSPTIDTAKKQSPKLCPTCGARGRCYSTSHGENFVRRYYRCDCGAHWSTYEMRADAFELEQ